MATASQVSQPAGHGARGQADGRGAQQRAPQRDEQTTDASPLTTTPLQAPSSEVAATSGEPLAGLLVEAGWPPQITAVAVPQQASQRASLRQFLETDAIELVPCGFGVWLCAAAGGSTSKRNFVAGPLAEIMRSGFCGEVHGPAIFLGEPAKGSGKLTALNGAQQALVHRAYAIVVTNLMDRAERDVEFRESLGAAVG